jgi:two-component system response regulator PhoP
VRVDSRTGNLTCEPSSSKTKPRYAKDCVRSWLKAGFTVDVAADGEEGLFAGLEYPIDVAVVDLGCRSCRASSDPALAGQGRRFPILILTARDRWQDKVEGLMPAPMTTWPSPFTS